MVCPKCFETIPEDSAFCEYCGTKVHIEVPKESNHIKEHKKSTSVLICVCAAILALISCFIFMKISYDSNYQAYYEKAYTNYIDTHKANGTLEYTIDASAKQTNYYHLGDDISITYSINNREIGSYYTYRPVAGQNSVSITTKIIEYDSHPDVGTGTAILDLSKNDTTKTISITVYERGGARYKGAYATYDITFTATPIVNEADLKMSFFRIAFLIVPV